MKTKPLSTVERLTQEMLGRIRSDEWPVGSLVPGERVLMGQFGVSRIALREALSHLRALGVLDTEHGRGSVVRRVDATALTQLFPLMVAEGGQTVGQMFEFRLALESTTATLAAGRRTDAEATEITRLAERFRNLSDAAAGRDEAMVVDMEFHMAVARAAHNPLFPASLGTITEFIKHVQTAHSGSAGLDPGAATVVSGLHQRYVRSIDCTRDPVRRQRSATAHEAIAEAIRARDAVWARAEMEAHLKYSAARTVVSEETPRPA